MQTTLLTISPRGIGVYQLLNDKGMRVQVLTYGARIAGLWVPDRTGNMVDVVAGFAQPDRWLGDNPYFNAVIGPVANRIDHARYVWEGVRYDLQPNDGCHALHGSV